jgi:MFS family permease
MATRTQEVLNQSSYAAADFNRWLIPVAAVLVQICIGSVYAWSTFNRPINALFPAPPADSWLAWFKAPYITFSAALVLLGLSAAFGGPWVERRGPRVAATTAACFFGAGLLIGGLGLRIGQEWLVFVGMGVIGGIGCGLGYIAPVSTLVKWFPDRRGMATGMAIMGFGAGAFLAGYLNAYLVEHIGVANTLFGLGAIYFVVMNIGAMIIRRPAPGWKPAGWVPRTISGQVSSEASLTRNAAVRTYQFWLLWGMLFLNVTAGIGILAQASPMMQDMFGKTAVQAGVVVSIISLFNAGGRFFWASLSDYIGRRMTYFLFFALGTILFVIIPRVGAAGDWILFQIALYIVFTMYGGGFATIPAFLADMFGPNNVGAIHGAILTAWSAAAVAGPVIITRLSDSAKAALVPGESKVHIYDQPLQVLAYLLALGFILTLMVRSLRGTTQGQSS